LPSLTVRQFSSLLLVVVVVVVVVTVTATVVTVIWMGLVMGSVATSLSVSSTHLYTLDYSTLMYS
jgi:ABC-type enterochelin transport system permease subunit